MYPIPQKPKAADLLKGKRALVTSSKAYMGPAICERFAEEGATVIEVETPYFETSREVNDIVAAAGDIDILVINQSFAARHSASDEIEDSYYKEIMKALPENTMWFARAALHQMMPRQAGKIVAVTSGAALYGAPESAVYTCARGAQDALLYTMAHEAAAFNVQINIIGQNIVKNPTFWSDETINTPYIQEMLKHDVPAGRFAEGWETADLAVFLASDRNNFLCGERLAFTGGWITWSRDINGIPWGDNSARGQA